jgi:hypothetical protein
MVTGSADAMRVFLGTEQEKISPVRSGARTKLVKAAVVGWAIAESPAAGFGADHDRTTSLPSQSS